jgi:23S rRNA pseudouridine2605 synthase
MTERRETDRRAKRSPARKPARKPDPTPAEWSEGERIAKYLARCGVASRREIESLISEGAVAVNGHKLDTPAFKVTGRERITVNGELVKRPERTRLWRYHKPAGLVTTNSDPEGRATVFQELPKSLPRTVTIGRLDLTTEGLLLLTNDGELARKLELPDTGLTRTYRARAHGRVTPEALKALKDGVTTDDGETYGSIIAELERELGANSWLRVSLQEGRKREVRRALEAVGLMVNRLIRVSYGPFELGKLQPGAVEEVPESDWRARLGMEIEGRSERKPATRRRPQRRKR